MNLTLKSEIIAGELRLCRLCTVDDYKHRFRCRKRRLPIYAFFVRRQLGVLSVDPLYIALIFFH